MNILNRRRLMGDNLYTPEGYIKNGLIFLLDGINKGATDGTWVDLIGGKVFTLNNTEYIESVDNGFRFINPNGQNITVCFTNSSGLVGNASWTMEGACTAENAISGASLFSSSNRGFGISLNGTYKFANGTNAWTTNNTRNGSIILSLGENIGVENGILLTSKWGGTGQMTTSGFRVGCCLNKNHNFYGTIHSIRIYNRTLTLDEILYNQNIDNRRFNLGLTFPE